MAFKETMEKLEPECKTFSNNYREVFALSQAISLKRIADALEKLVFINTPAELSPELEEQFNILMGVSKRGS